MMKRLLLIPLLAGALALGGCFETAGNGPAPKPIPDITNIITKVQTATTQVCAFVPAASTIAGIIDALGAGGTASSVTGIAAQICAAVTSKSARRSSRPAKLYGVPIKGHFVR